MNTTAHIEREGILPLFTSVRDRRLEPELMDRQDLDRRLRDDALRGLQRINVLSQTPRIMWGPIRDLARALNRPVRLLDMASGGGDCAIGIQKLADSAGIRVEVHGCDLSPDTVAYAQERADRAGTSARFFVCDVTDGVPGGYDVITNTLFMHHLDETATESILRAMRAANPRLIVISDLIRCTPGFLLAHAACRVVTRSYIVHYDGPRSVAAAYTAREFSAIADRAGLAGHRIRWSWPFRFQFTWKPS